MVRLSPLRRPSRDDVLSPRRGVTVAGVPDERAGPETALAPSPMSCLTVSSVEATELSVQMGLAEPPPVPQSLKLLWATLATEAHDRWLLTLRNCLF